MVRPYTTRTGPTTAAVLAAVDGLGESDALTIRQLVDVVYGEFTSSRQRTVTRVVADLKNTGLVHGVYQMTASQPDGPPALMATTVGRSRSRPCSSGRRVQASRGGG